MPVVGGFGESPPQGRLQPDHLAKGGFRSLLCLMPGLGVRHRCLPEETKPTARPALPLGIAWPLVAARSMGSTRTAMAVVLLLPGVPGRNGGGFHQLFFFGRSQTPAWHFGKAWRNSLHGNGLCQSVNPAVRQGAAEDSTRSQRPSLNPGGHAICLPPNRWNSRNIAPIAKRSSMAGRRR